MIRPLQTSEISTLAAQLANLPLMQRYGQTSEKLATSMAAAQQAGHVLVTYGRDDALGLMWMIPSGGFGGRYLRLLAVLPGYQSAGIGAQLMSAFEDLSVAAGRHAFLLVSDFNRPAQRFYERHGYINVGVVPRMVLSDVDELIYWKKL